MSGLKLQGRLLQGDTKAEASVNILQKLGELGPHSEKNGILAGIIPFQIRSLTEIQNV